MDLSSLQRIIDQTFGWIRHPADLYRRCPSVTDSQFTILRHYALQLGVDSHFGLRMHKMVLEMVVSFLQDGVKKLFELPNPSDPSLKKHQNVAAFIGFLLQILHLGKNVDFPKSSNLIEELRSLVAMLGDTPFQATEAQKLQALLSEFELVANEAGSIVHSALFSPHPPAMEIIEAESVALLQHFHRLKAEVIDFLNSLPISVVAPSTDISLDLFFSFDSAVHDVEDLLKRDGNLPSDLKDLVAVLHQQLHGYRTLVRDVDSSHFLKNEGLKEVVVQIRQVAFEADYLIKSFFVGDAHSWYVTVRLTHLIEKIKYISTQLLKLKKDYDDEAIKSVLVSTAQPSRRANRDLEVEDIMPIFEKEEMGILDRLVGGAKKEQRISILGMGGIGKTTLAKKLYNNPLVHNHFDRRLWCTISQKLELRNVLVSLGTSLGELDKAAILKMQEDSLAEHIYKGLFDRRFFVVVDDLWHWNDWDCLQRCFPHNENGSRILLSTRSQDVAQNGNLIYELPLLSNDQCLQLLKKKMFRYCEPHHPPQLGKIEETIASKCYGLPLVVVVLAGMLSSMDEEEITLKIVGSLDNYVPFDEFASIMQILKLSYENLPPYLKPCFLYFGAFQETPQISIKTVKQRWVAEGFICKEENERADDVAEQYVKELIQRNLIIVSERRSNGGAKSCIIHDLLHDLCVTIAKKENFMVQVHGDYSVMQNQNYSRFRVFVGDQKDKASLFVPFGLHLHSLYVSPWETTSYLYNVKLLRVLVGGYLIGSEFLFHLRYLTTHRVPPLVHRNENLEFLNISDLLSLTPEILKMLKLRHIRCNEREYGKDCETIQENNLEYLAVVVIHSKKDVELMRCSTRLRTLKCEYDWSASEASDPSIADFNYFTQCESLKVSFRDFPGVAALKFPSSIRKLELRRSKLPWEKMSIIGALPNLEVLKLGSRAFEGKIWCMGDEEYRRLKCFKMECLEFSEWVLNSNVNLNQQFPSLQKLVLKGCDQLREIPSEIGDIAALCVIEIIGHLCQESLVDSAKKIEDEQRDMGNDELEVILKQSVTFPSYLFMW